MIGAVAAVHAVSGIAALIAGFATLHRVRWAGAYLVSLILCIAALAPLLVVGWGEQSSVERVIFSALGVLGLVVVERGVRAVWSLRADGQRSQTFLHRIGFTLIALLDAFVVILALDLGAPGWLLAAIGIAVAVVGNRILDRAAVSYPVG